MLDWVLTHVRRTKHGGDALRVFLWWGFGVRAVLLVAMLTLLVVRGNFLAKWLWSLDILLVPTADIGKLTVASYVLLAGFLTVGALIRWGVLARLDAPATAADTADAAPGDETDQKSDPETNPEADHETDHDTHQEGDAPIGGAQESEAQGGGAQGSGAQGGDGLNETTDQEGQRSAPAEQWRKDLAARLPDVMMTVDSGEGRSTGDPASDSLDESSSGRDPE